MHALDRDAGCRCANGVPGRSDCAQNVADFCDTRVVIYRRNLVREVHIRRYNTIYRPDGFFDCRRTVRASHSADPQVDPLGDPRLVGRLSSGTRMPFLERNANHTLHSDLSSAQCASGSAQYDSAPGNFIERLSGSTAFGSAWRASFPSCLASSASLRALTFVRRTSSDSSASLHRKAIASDRVACVRIAFVETASARPSCPSFRAWFASCPSSFPASWGRSSFRLFRHPPVSGLALMMTTLLPITEPDHG